MTKHYCDFCRHEILNVGQCMAVIGTSQKKELLCFHCSKQFGKLLDEFRDVKKLEMEDAYQICDMCGHRFNGEHWCRHSIR